MSKIRCYHCRGAGIVTRTVMNLFDFFTVTEDDECNACYGKGYIYE